VETALKFGMLNLFSANTNARAVESVSLRPLACWACGFDSRRGHGCLFWLRFVR